MLSPCCCLQKPELAGRIEALHDSDRLALVVLDVSLHLADFILQLAARVFEGVVEGKCQVRMALVSGRRAPRIDLAAFRQKQVKS